jgi:hypothetical protein
MPLITAFRIGVMKRPVPIPTRNSDGSGSGLRALALATAGSLVILDGAFGIVSPIASRLTSFGVRRIMMAGVLVDPVGSFLHWSCAGQWR